MTYGAILAVALSLATAESRGATLTFGSQTLISSGGDFSISVFDGEARYGGLATGALGDGTVEAYALFQNADGGTGSGDVTPIVRYAEKAGSLLGTPTLTNTGTSGTTFANANVWTTNDPGSPGFGGTPNFATGTGTITGGRVSNGTIDISGYSAGTVYLLAGAYQNTLPVVLSMTGPSQMTLNADNGTLNTATTRNMYVFEFDFDNSDGLYDEISYSILSTGSNFNNRARYMGVIIDAVAVPEPGVMMLGGLGAVLLLVRWRRRS